MPFCLPSCRCRVKDSLLCQFPKTCSVSIVPALEPRFPLHLAHVPLALLGHLSTVSSTANLPRMYASDLGVVCYSDCTLTPPRRFSAGTVHGTSPFLCHITTSPHHHTCTCCFHVVTHPHSMPSLCCCVVSRLLKKLNELIN